MRILIVLHQFYPEFSSGTERVALNLAKAAQRAGHYVRVLACAVNPEVHHGAASKALAGALETVWEGLPVTLLPRAMLPASADYSLDVVPELVEHLVTWMKQERFELAHILHTMRMSTVVVAAQQCNLPYVLTLTDFFLACPRINLVTLDNQMCSGPQGGKKCGKDCLTVPWNRETLIHRHQSARQMLMGAGMRVVPSEFVAARFLEAFADCSFRVLPHGVDLLALMGDDIPMRSDHAQMTLGYVGSIIPQKGLSVLLHAFARVKSPSVRLKVVGGFYGADAYHKDVLALVKADPRVELLGHLDAAEVYAAIRQMDVLCLPSQVPETFSLALHEAAALGVPAMVSNLGAPGLLVAGHGGGTVVQSNNVAAWTAAIDALVKEPEQLGRWQAQLPLPVRIEEEAFFYDSLYRTLLQPA
jgi:glycosyltransferase involved in cell wall biosynthesis